MIYVLCWGCLFIAGFACVRFSHLKGEINMFVCPSATYSILLAAPPNMGTAQDQVCIRNMLHTLRDEEKH